jgi:hypothetical protein
MFVRFADLKARRAEHGNGDLLAFVHLTDSEIGTAHGADAAERLTKQLDLDRFHVEPPSSRILIGFAGVQGSIYRRRVAVPELIPLTGGRFQARCHFCKCESTSVLAATRDEAWSELTRLGWGPYQPVPAAIVKALCNSCLVKEIELQAAVKRAHRARRRK